MPLSLVNQKTINKVLKLEILVAESKFKMKDLHELISYYSTFVEYYDLKSDPIKNYFIEKIQLLIANKDTIHALCSVNPKLGKTGLASIAEFEIERRDTDQEMVKTSRKSQHNRFNAEELVENKRRHSYKDTKKVRSHEVEMQLKLEDDL